METEPSAVNGLEPLLSIDDLAVYLGVPVTTIYDWRTAGKGPRGIRIGHWAHRIATHPAPADELARFPYITNYARLCRMELGILASATSKNASSVTFVGGGPLPLTALLIAKECGAAVEVVDHDPQAVRVG